MTSFEAVRLVAGRELRETVRSKAFWIASGLLFVGATAAMVVPELLHDDHHTTTYDVVVVAGHDDPGLAHALHGVEPALGATLHLTRVDTRGEGEHLVDDKRSDLAIVPGDAPEVIVRSGQHDLLVAAVRQALATDVLAQRLADQGLDDQQVRDVLAVPVARVHDVDTETDARRGASFAVSLVLYILLLTLMFSVANGTAAEKANRISEVLLPIVRAGPLLFGKVVGTSLAGIATLVAGMVPVIVKLGLGGDLPKGLGSTLLGSGAWFALGLALFLTVAGTLGALVERQEEAGSAIMPVTAVLVGTFLVTQSTPDSTLASVLAWVPFSSPLVVPARLAIGVAGPVELAGSLAVLVLTLGLVARFGATVYALAIVRTGRRLKLSEVLRSS